MLAPGQTRWLSLQACVQRVLENWEHLLEYWRLLVFDDKSHANEQVLTTLSNPLLKVVMEFAEYGLGLFNDFNTFFQSDAPLFGELKGRVEELLKTLALNFMYPSYVRSTDGLNIDPMLESSYIPLDKVYMGLTATVTLFNIPDADPREVKKLFKTIQEFYIEAVQQVKKRFVFERSDHFSDAEFLVPDNARNLKPSSIHPIAKKYLQNENPTINYVELDKQWRSQSILSNTTNDMHEYWKNVFNANDGGIPKFKDLAKFASIFFSLPFSNAVTERLFSCLVNIKTEKRNRLDNETLSSLLCIKYGMKRTSRKSHHFMESSGKLSLGVKVSSASASTSRNIRLGIEASASASKK